MPRPVSKGSDYDYSDVDGTAYVVLKAELEFIWASFASKIPLLALFWYSTSSMDSSNPDEFNTGAAVLAGVAFLISTAGVIYFYRRRAKISINKLKKYHLWAGAAQLSAALAMLIYVAATNVMEAPPNRYGFVVNNYAVWEEQGEGFRTFDETSKVGPGFALPYLPPAFAAISGTQHLFSYFALTWDLLFTTYSGCWLPRYIDYALSTPLIFVTNAYFFSMSLNLFTVLLIFATYMVIMAAGFSSEVAWYENISAVSMYVPFVAAFFAFVLSWVTPLVQLQAGADASGENDLEPPLLVYFFVIWVIFSFAFFPFITLRKLLSSAGLSSYSYTPGNRGAKVATPAFNY